MTRWHRAIRFGRHRSKELNLFADRSHKGSNVRTLEKFLAKRQTGSIADSRKEAFFRSFSKGRDGAPDIAWYRGLFAPTADKMSGDISPLYATLNDAGVRRVASTCPDAKYILLTKPCQFLGRIFTRTGQQIGFPVLPLPARQT